MSKICVDFACEYVTSAPSRVAKHNPDAIDNVLVNLAEIKARASDYPDADATEVAERSIAELAETTRRLMEMLNKEDQRVVRQSINTHL